MLWLLLWHSLCSVFFKKAKTNVVLADKSIVAGVLNYFRIEI